ncbi:MAG: hypothetical protein JRJ45_06850 [Deltaproteobacteria bacterium]|nr:hypothetical protein [Deltaproteobacteria bacterium]
MDILFFKLTLIVYLIASAGFLFFIIKKNKKVGYWSHRIMLLGFALNSIYLTLSYYQLGAVPALTFKTSLSFLSWTIIAAYIIFQVKFKLMVLGSFVVPFSTFLMIISSTIPISTITVRPIFKGLWLPALMYLIQERQIKSKKLGAFYTRLPSLNSLDSLNYHAINYGFLLLTIFLL